MNVKIHKLLLSLLYYFPLSPSLRVVGCKKWTKHNKERLKYHQKLTEDNMNQHIVLEVNHNNDIQSSGQQQKVKYQTILTQKKNSDPIPSSINSK